jgi:long-chain acyl-CoA synthetase
MKSEGIEALVYPSPDFFKGSAPKEAASDEAIKTRINAIIAEVNQRLLPYQRIEKVTILVKEMEMTTTKKINRDAV